MTLEDSTQQTAHRKLFLFCLLLADCWVLIGGCGYTTRPGLAAHLRTVFVKPFVNQIDLTQLTTDYQRFPVYRPGMESEITSAVIDRFQFTGILRPARAGQADTRLEGELVEFRRDALRFNAAQQVEEWRLSVVVNVRLYDLTTHPADGGTPPEGGELPLWEEERFTGDTTYFELGANAESESTARDRAIRDLARRIVERTVEDW